MKPHICLTLLAVGVLPGCRLAGLPSTQTPPHVAEPQARSNAQAAGETVHKPVALISDQVARIPAIEPEQDESAAVRLAAYEIQPQQEPEHIVPEEVELPLPHETGGLTLYDLEQSALSRNPALGQAHGRIQALQGKWVQVGLKPNPTAGYVSEEMGDDGTAGKQGAFIGQQFITGKKRQLSREVVAQEIARAEADYATIEQRVRTDVQMAYYDVLIAQRRVSVVRELVAIAQKAVQSSEALLKAEEVGPAAVLQSKVEANMALILSEQAENARRAAWRRLTAVIAAPEMPLQSLAGDIEDIAQAYDFDELAARIVSSSPQLAAAYAEVERARWALSRAEVEAIPNINAQVVVQHDNATGDDLAGVQLGIPLPIFDRNQGGIEQAAGDIFTAEQNIARIELRLRNQLAEVFQAYADARVQVDKYAGEILPQAKQTLQLMEKGYQAGELDFLSLLTAQRTYSQTNLAYLDALRQLWSRSAEIDGLLLRDSLNSEP